MALIERTAEALLDIRQITVRIAADNTDAASKWLLELEQLFSLFASQPRMGERVRTRRFGIVRRFSRGNYVVYYRVRGGGIEILRVIHGARDQDRLVYCST